MDGNQERMLLRILVLVLFGVVAQAWQSIHSNLPVNFVRPGRLEMISHGKGFNKLGLPADQRKALLRALTTEVIRHGRIRTTIARAKELRSRVDKMITLAKKGTLHHRRQALAYIYDKKLVATLFAKAMERYGERNGGYCRIKRDENRRRGDFAQMAFVELV